MGSGPGFGRWTGLRGARQAPKQGAAVRSLSLLCRRCPPVPLKKCVCPTPVAAKPIPNAAPRCAPLLEPAGASAERRSGPQRRWCCSGSVGCLPTPRRRSAPGLSSQLIALSRRAGECVLSGIHPQGSRSAVLEGDARWTGSNGPACPLRVRCKGGRWREALMVPLVPRARTGVSPALPWNTLGCVGAGAPALLCCESGRGGSRPPLQSHFGWRPAINSELARTRGIRLSN